MPTSSHAPSSAPSSTSPTNPCPGRPACSRPVSSTSPSVSVTRCRKLVISADTLAPSTSSSPVAFPHCPRRISPNLIYTLLPPAIPGILSPLLLLCRPSPRLSPACSPTWAHAIALPIVLSSSYSPTTTTATLGSLVAFRY